MVTFHVRGELDISNAASLERTVVAVLQRSPTPEVVRLELADLEFIDSMGLGVLLRVRGRARRLGCRLAISSTSPFVDRVFVVSGRREILRGAA
jgi:anti-anti-sigma factor